jgi:hypothetical protein
MVMNFVRGLYPQARFEKIYDAECDGWHSDDFHRHCDEMGWTLSIVETVDGFIFGGFTTAEWEYPRTSPWISKRDPYSFLFSVNEGEKYPI